MAAGGLLFPTAATAGADVPVGPGAHAVRSARAAGATVVDLTEITEREESPVARWLTGWGDSYLAANRILANSGGNTFHWSGASSWVALALVIVPFALVGAGLYLRNRRR
jgi:hypothetical protein